MYRKHFGLIRHPFHAEIEADDLFLSEGAKELEARLRHLVELRGIGLITAEPGTGKTSLTRRFTQGLHTGQHRVFYVPNSTGHVMDLYKTIAWELGLPTERSRAALFKVIRNEVTRLCVEAKLRPLLIVDEAHQLRSDVLEELRMLTNYAMDSENRLCMLLLGQSELRRRLSMAVHEALNQRIVVRYQLPPLSREELADYLVHRLRLAKCELPLFEAAAMEAMYQATGARPRKLNLLAHHALHAAAQRKAKTVDADHVRSAMAEVN